METDWVGNGVKINRGMETDWVGNGVKINRGMETDRLGGKWGKGLQRNGNRQAVRKIE